MQNSEIDLLMEPDIETDFVWRSKDIFVRNQDDGDLISVHQNPEYSDNLLWQAKCLRTDDGKI